MVIITHPSQFCTALSVLTTEAHSQSRSPVIVPSSKFLHCLPDSEELQPWKCTQMRACECRDGECSDLQNISTSALMALSLFRRGDVMQGTRDFRVALILLPIIFKESVDHHIMMGEREPNTPYPIVQVTQEDWKSTFGGRSSCSLKIDRVKVCEGMKLASKPVLSSKFWLHRVTGGKSSPYCVTLLLPVLLLSGSYTRHMYQVGIRMPLSST
ncbi:hypothetical protein DPEC_G00108890 [Dallia pectoralis]|uniref:Uncharacterized protein n=1 Tax=Dallia pectoralis TaxID=75939 RepID=A0ACC2GSF7_DALPE|nr:hypothetical protein DPEC_G00108890 [Dallia pectoralis]